MAKGNYLERRLSGLYQIVGVLGLAQILVICSRQKRSAQVQMLSGICDPWLLKDCFPLLAMVRRICP